MRAGGLAQWRDEITHVGFAAIFDACHPHGAAQIRRGETGCTWSVLGAPRFSPYRRHPSLVFAA